MERRKQPMSKRNPKRKRKAKTTAPVKYIILATAIANLATSLIILYEKIKS